MSDIGERDNLFGARGSWGESRVLSPRRTADASDCAFRYYVFDFSIIYHTFKALPTCLGWQIKPVCMRNEIVEYRIFFLISDCKENDKSVSGIFNKTLVQQMSRISLLCPVYSAALHLKCTSGNVNLHLYPTYRSEKDRKPRK